MGVCLVVDGADLDLRYTTYYRTTSIACLAGTGLGSFLEEVFAPGGRGMTTLAHLGSFSDEVLPPEEEG